MVSSENADLRWGRLVWIACTVSQHKSLLQVKPLFCASSFVGRPPLIAVFGSSRALREITSGGFCSQSLLHSVHRPLNRLLEKESNTRIRHKKEPISFLRWTENNLKFCLTCSKLVLHIRNICLFFLVIYFGLSLCTYGILMYSLIGVCVCTSVNWRCVSVLS